MNDLTKQQKQVHDSVLSWYQSWCSSPHDSGNEFLTIGGYAGTGKAHPIDTKIQTPNGPKEIGNLKIGDYVFGRNGKPIKVTGIFPQGIQQAYKITFRDNSFVEANEEHLWAVWTHKLRQERKPYKVITTREIMDVGIKFDCGIYRFSIPLCDPVEYQEKELPINPYLLGLLIGDGTSLGFSPTLSTKDVEIIEYINEIKPSYITIVEDLSSNCPRYRLVDYKYRGNRLNKIFRTMNLDVNSVDRFLPEIYKYSSINQRYELLRGLMDSDGSCSKNRTSFSTNSEKLSNDIIELVQSLGGVAIKRAYNRHDKINIEYQINIKTLENPFKLKRKKEKWKFSSKNPPSRHIISIEKSRFVEQVCISVDADDNLYLADNYIVTHNTFLLARLRASLHQLKFIKVAFCTYTGKAASVLESKLIAANTIYKQDTISTIHRLMYEPVWGYDPSTRKKIIIKWRKSEHINADLIIIDEGSMVNKQIWDDLTSYGIPILVVGDHGQLPPVGDKFCLLTKPDLTLTEVQRQALDSPIVNLSMLIRQNGYIPNKIFSPEVFKLSWNHPKCKELFESVEFNTDTIALCGFNVTRQKLNKKIRDKLGFNIPEPHPSERVVCLRNNTYSKIANGQTGTVVWCLPREKNIYDMTIEMDGRNEYYSGLVHSIGFGAQTYDDVFDAVKSETAKKALSGTEYMQIDAFDYGNVLSVHKSQGSEWERVVLFEQRSKHWDAEYFARWLYTGVTRAVSKLFVISDYY